ncbi:4'-phosphopantetheinyl transferase family protein [Spirosoma utsteinense]|uniref:4'-phosphopantetheinyl transferase n=1 Tax=Spirosoma utsteinense TaxID=2585773 RepID=A0ABR6WFN0_9BACT|nr:4'-phosphopantetheinyl transferase superfamily protein [Spirosoma utsteinense]MBC3789461.1 4'-phosphopantetheinyl transferase [Spirosoma utsteinense]MBC3795360.1 4'-phosphopantetheinyl transferase [Spirosoma utsteinense]
MHLYFATIDALSPDTFQNHLLKLPDFERSKVAKYHRPQDAYLSVLGKALLMKGLSNYGYDADLKANYKLTAFGRPYLLNGPGFNISHSSDVAVCVIAENKIGVDVEKVRDIELDGFADYFSPAEWDSIQRATNPFVEFYTLWCKKEAVIKADGKGLSNSLEKVVTLTDKTELSGNIYYTRMHLIHPDYIVATAYTSDHEVTNSVKIITI